MLFCSSHREVIIFSIPFFLTGQLINFHYYNPFAPYFSQLELITELLGTPTLEDMRHACEGARTHMLRRAPKPPSLSALYTLSTHATHEAVHLLCQMLVFDPVSVPFAARAQNPKP